MSSDTTSINQLPSQELSNQQPLNNQPMNGQNINMIVQENAMSRTDANNEKRLTADEMNARIHGMNSTISAQPSQIPQPTTQQPNIVQQNEMSNLLNSINQLNLQQTTSTKMPLHQINNHMTNIDPMTQVNNIGPQLNTNELTQRLRENQTQHETMNYENQTQGHLQERKTFYKTWFDELKIPLLICCLFFIFQMPFYRQNLHKHFEFLFQSDGNMNLYGYLTSSILFSLGYYLLNKIVR